MIDLDIYGLKLNHQKKLPELEPYEVLCMEVVLLAVRDYKRYAKLKRKHKAMSSKVELNGLTAKTFLESPISNLYSGIDPGVNIRLAVDETLNAELDIDSYYEKVRKEYRNVHKSERKAG